MKPEIVNSAIGCLQPEITCVCGQGNQRGLPDRSPGLHRAQVGQGRRQGQWNQGLDRRADGQTQASIHQATWHHHSSQRFILGTNTLRHL